MRVTLISIPVRDQLKALEFYTNKLGFVVHKNVDMGGGNRWITLLSKDLPEGPEILLEPGPLHFEPCKVYQDALLEANYPYTQFDVDDVQSEYNRLLALGVEFLQEPKEMGEVKTAVLNDTVGNNIMLIEYLKA